MRGAGVPTPTAAAAAATAAAAAAATPAGVHAAPVVGSLSLDGKRPCIAADLVAGGGQGPWAAADLVADEEGSAACIAAGLVTEALQLEPWSRCRRLRRALS